MERNEELLMNDHLFMEGLRCPLKLRMMMTTTDKSFRKNEFRQRNKLHLRDAVSLRFNNVRQTPNETDQAERSTLTWLQLESEVAVCGAVVKYGSMLTRIPLLRKKDSQLTLIQVHGKLKTVNSGKSAGNVNSFRHLKDYLVRAAYRKAIIERAYPEYQTAVEFYHPVKGSRAKQENLHNFKNLHEPESVSQQFLHLLAGHDVTGEAEEISGSLSGPFIHPLYQGLSVEEAIRYIEGMMHGSISFPEIEPHTGCRPCIYRKETGDQPGCWKTHFTTDGLVKPDLHLFELVGHGNNREIDHGELYQEQVSVHDLQDSFEAMKNSGSKKISIQQRRTLQILKAKDLHVPQLWVKKELAGLGDYRKPLHFIDFEAAAYAIPMRSGMTPYQPLFYQFSCHTLHETGIITHTEWLDLDLEEKDIHRIFVKELQKIPDIEEGTIVHYSPFEKQALQQLFNEFRSRNDGEGETAFLGRITGHSGKRDTRRFLDLSTWIRDYYYNRFMINGLSLKETFKAVLKYEQKKWGDADSPGREERESAKRRWNSSEDPYSDIQIENSGIQDGSSAMNAWISFKCGLLTAQELSYIPQIMKKYCELDSMALLHVAEHLLELGEKLQGDLAEDIIEEGL